MKPLVSIIIPAYNAEDWVGYTLQSAVAQTWSRKEIVVVDDGSTDRTPDIVRGFVSKGVRLLSTENRGLSAAVNYGLKFCEGDYIQELDADDILAPEKIERQMMSLREGDSKRLLLSSPMAYFYYRTRNARYFETPLCQDLTPVEWLLRKMGGDLHMQNATWLPSRELVEAAGPWKEDLWHDQDGEYFCRVLLASEGTRFVPGAGVYYRQTGMNRVSFIGNSNKKKDSLFASMNLHVQYLRSLEESERVRAACLTYLQKWSFFFYPERLDLLSKLEILARELGGNLTVPALRWKFAWIRPFLGWRAAKWAQMTIPQYKAAIMRRWDKALFEFETRKDQNGIPTSSMEMN